MKDIWDYHENGDHIVIPTNTTRKFNGEAVMGAGLAKQARYIFPELPKLYGDYLQLGKTCYIYREGRLILVPTKTDWRQPASLELVANAVRLLNMAANLLDFCAMVVVPPLGCGLGGLRWEDVKPILETLPTSRFIVLDPTE